MENGEWKMENGKWKIEGRRQIEIIKWILE
jgi:hypothetical protein